MTQTIKFTVSSYEGRNDYLIRGETKVCPVWGHHVSLAHECDKAH